MRKAAAVRVACRAMTCGKTVRSTRVAKAAIETLENRRLLSGGTFDPSFGGGDGVALVNFVETSTDRADSVAIQSDGKIVVAGHTGDGSNTQNAFALARLNPDGTPDASFDGDGRVVTSLGGTAAIQHVALQSDGKILAGGRVGSGAEGDWALVRYHTDGSLDASFGAGGVVTTDFYGYGDSLESLTVQADGKIVATGVGLGSTSQLATVRYNADGSLDTTFANNGKAIVDFFGGVDFASDVIQQPDGKLVVAGGSVPSGSYRRFVLLRYNTDGSLDTSFDGDGKAFTDFGVSAFGRQVALDADGKLVVGGLVGGSGTTMNYAVARYNANGSLDTTYNGTGYHILPDVHGHTFTSYGLAIDSDNRAIFGGYGNNLDNYDTYFSLARFDADGTLDATFGNSGTLELDLATRYSGWGSGSDLALDADGNIVMVGEDYTSTSFDFAVIRLLPGEAPPPPPSDPVVLNAHGTLSITGTDGNDVVDVANNFAGSIVVTFNGTAYPFPFADVATIAADLGDGDDSLVVQQVLFKPVSYTGGIGTDSLLAHGSAGNDDDATIHSFAFNGGGNSVTWNDDVDEVTVDLGFGYDHVTVDAPNYNGQINVLGGAGNDRFDLINGPATLGAGQTQIAFDGGNGDDEFYAFGGVSVADVTGGAGTNAIYLLGRSGGQLDEAHLRLLFDFSTLLNTSGPDTPGLYGFEFGTDITAIHVDLAAGDDDDLYANYDPAMSTMPLTIDVTGAATIDWNARTQSSVPVTTTLSFGAISSGSIAVTFDNAAEAIILGGTHLADRFDVTPIAQEVTVLGLSPKPEIGDTGEDVLALDLTNATDLVSTDNGTNGSFAFDNAGTIFWDGIEAFEGLPTARPSLVSGLFDFESDQVVELVLADTNFMSVGLSEAVLTNLTTGQTVANPFHMLSVTGPGNDTVASFHRLAYSYGTLPNGNYRFTLPAGSIESNDGLANDTAITHDFCVLAGDANRDRQVSLADFLILRANFGQSGKVFSEGDFNYDGTVSLADFLILRANFGTNLPPPPSASPLPSLFGQDGGNGKDGDNGKSGDNGKGGRRIARGLI